MKQQIFNQKQGYILKLISFKAPSKVKETAHTLDTGYLVIILRIIFRKIKLDTHSSQC